MFVFTMQADDMGNKEYSHENVFYCICLVVYELVKVSHPKLKGKEEFYSCPKAFVLMSKHPFFNLHIDILSQIMQIYKYDQLETSKMMAMHNNQ